MTQAKPRSECNIQPCMPPLLPEERNTGKVGDITSFVGGACEHIIIKHFLNQKINCAEPIVDDGADLLIERDGKNKPWVRGQIKKVVHSYQPDRGMRKRGTGLVYRDSYNFFFQTNNYGTRSPADCDYFYHVLLTPYRELIWETPSSIIPLSPDGSFINNKVAVLDRAAWKKKPTQIDWRKSIISAQYDPKVIEAFPEFFNPSTVTNFMV